MLAKNHDYDQAVAGMRVSSYTDLIFEGKSIVPSRLKVTMDYIGIRGIDANYMDMINYSVFD